MSYHDPVLLHACVDGLRINPSGTYVDVTFGGGGHSREILKHLGPDGRLFAFDQDNDALGNVPEDDRFTLIPHNFRYLKNYLKLYKAIPVDGILADLGVSSHQFDEAGRGFSIRFDAPLDMRMNSLQDLNAAKLLESYPEEELRRIFKEYGELNDAGKLARHLVNVRSDRPIKTTGQLMDLIRPFMRRGQEHSFAAQVFQSIRIEVNDELESLRQLLLQTVEVLKPGGRLVVMSYHSLEDRLVKNFIRSGKFSGEAEKDLFGHSHVPYQSITRKPIRPDEEELEKNNRARSAVLRIAEKNEA
ncbi:MAG TPA: 16S rRNA (cytosine(1402)-N(4))-methyltransferase RsmH [Flavobacteriales bacterium]|jgi:16S rRNA (cytosine1402-N4)-methyltransferase|nr:16S rRNA (cytosine(1402)-N(4))-methyltransferase RsmH [Flavobacteriales bacterium]HPH81027.1 16S rRNA (cytosine(1402)-N(4))-methyltransferase RsmH [Flavobacteriales bacterium]